jgi:hypothetical protein
MQYFPQNSDAHTAKTGETYVAFPQKNGHLLASLPRFKLRLTRFRQATQLFIFISTISNDAPPVSCFNTLFFFCK